MKDALIEFVSSLNWPAAVLFLGAIFILVFRKQIAELIPKLRKIKIRNFEADTSTPKVEEEQIRKKEEQAQEDKYEEEKKEPEIKEIKQPKTLKEWRTEMIFSSFENNLERTNEAFGEIKKLNKDELSFKKDEILYLKLSHRIGNTDAISKLRKFIADIEVSHEANMALGFCYVNASDFENSALYFSQALEKAKDEDEKSSSASHYSSSLYRDGKKDKAIEVLIESLSVAKEDKYKIRLYESLADIYEEEKDYENRAFVLDKAVELRPNDAELLFKSAFSYSESNYDELSLLHYKKAKTIDPEDESIQNNLGVQYDKLKMPIKSILSYKEAERLGNTLASANLAYRLMGAGFTEEATKILDSVKDKEDVHPNVNSALSEIPKKKEEEDKKEKERDKLAMELRKFFLEFTEAKFIKNNTLKSLAGEWKSKNGTLFQIGITGDKIEATWKRKFLSDYEREHKFEGTIFNNSSEIIFYDKEYDFSKSEYDYRKKGRGFLFCSESGDLIKFIRIDDAYRWKELNELVKNGAK